GHRLVSQIPRHKVRRRRAAVALSPLRRARQQSRLVHAHAGGNAEHESRDLPRVVPAAVRRRASDGREGPRMFIPPFADPVDPDVHPLIWREVNIVGSNMAFRLEQQNKAGLIYGYSFDAYWLGGTRNTGWWKNVTGLLLETASARVATPIEIEPSELRGGTKGLIEYKATINHPNPWKGGVWRMRDIM